MNLLIDKWIPVRSEEKIKYISLEELLCNNNDHEIITHRDDMQLATLQMLICLTQVLFEPKDEVELSKYLVTELNKKQFQIAIKDYLEWFDLKHIKWPFLQTRGVTSKEVTPIQKLFNGMPEGNNHTWRYESNSRINKVCANCAAIMLFNQSTNTPSFGGGFKNPLRGATPIITLVKGKTLRETIWLNILHKGFSSKHYLNKTVNIPNWVLRINKDDEVEGSNFSLLRGLFWQPGIVELIWQDEQAQAICDSCAITTNNIVVGFKRQKFAYKLISDFLHPHSPRYFYSKDGKDTTIYPSFKDLPWWTQVINLVLKRENGFPSLGVVQYQELFSDEELCLIFGGYNNNQSKITQRSYQIFLLPKGWLKNKKYLEIHLSLALEIGVVLRKKGYGVGKSMGLNLLPGDGLSNLLTQLQKDYYQEIESIMIDFIASINLDPVNEIDNQLVTKLTEIADKSLTDFTRSYSTYVNPVSVKQSIDITIKKLINA